MKYDLNAFILGPDNKPVPNVTLRTVVAEVLIGQIPGDEKMTPEEKGANYRLWLKVESPEPDFTVEEIGRIKARVGLACTTLVMGRVHEMLERPAATIQAAE